MSNLKPRRQRCKQARPGEIIATAPTLFHKNGFAASKIEDIVVAANVTKGTVYLSFPSKEELFKASTTLPTPAPPLNTSPRSSRACSTARFASWRKYCLSPNFL